MATLTQIKTWLDGGWKNDRHAKWRWFWYGLRKGIDTDGWYGFQCKDLVNAYSIWLGRPFTAGNAEALWRVAQNPWWTRVSAKSTPKIGDVGVMWWGQYEIRNGKKVWVEYGHTFIVRTNWSTTLKSLDQNWNNSNLNSGSPPSFITHTKNPNRVQYGIRGYLRPKLTTSTPTPAPVPPVIKPVFHTVISGDTVGAICAKYGISIETFKKLNPTVTNINVISVGQKLRVR